MGWHPCAGHAIRRSVVSDAPGIVVGGHEEDDDDTRREQQRLAAHRQAGASVTRADWIADRTDVLRQIDTIERDLQQFEQDYGSSANAEDLRRRLGRARDGRQTDADDAGRERGALDTGGPRL